jgi:hypothetical protein
MDLAVIADRPLAIRRLFEDYERRTYGRPWSFEEVALGLAGDVGDLAKLVPRRLRLAHPGSVGRINRHNALSCADVFRPEQSERPARGCPAIRAGVAWSYREGQTPKLTDRARQ